MNQPWNSKTDEQTIVSRPPVGRVTLIKGPGCTGAESPATPFVVSSAYFLFSMQAVLSAIPPFMCLFCFVGMRDEPEAGINSVEVFCVTCLVNLALSLITVWAIDTRAQWAWIWALLMLLLNSFSIPIRMFLDIYSPLEWTPSPLVLVMALGTICSLSILTFWFKPSIKAWFGRL